MLKTYIWEKSGWPYLTWDNKELSPLLGEVRNRQGQLTGKISLLGNDLKRKTRHEAIVSEILASAEIEGETLDEESVVITTRQALSKQTFQLTETDNTSTGASYVFLDALYNYRNTITEERLFSWKHALEGSIGYNSTVSKWPSKDDFFVSAPEKTIQRKMEYFKIPIPQNTAEEIKTFLNWANTIHPTDAVIKAGVAYLRFLLIRPFEKNNGRIARNIADHFLSHSDNTLERFYSISAQIVNDRKQYNELLKYIQAGDLDITEWLRWFLCCMNGALKKAEAAITEIIDKSRIFEKYRFTSFNERQIKMINLLWDDSDKKVSSSTWAAANKCSPDTALRDIQDLIAKDILKKEKGGGRNTSYCLNRI